MVNRTPHRGNILVYGYNTGSVLFTDRAVQQQYLVKNQYNLLRLRFIAIYNENHLSLVEANLYLFSNILLIKTFLIALECQINGGRGGGLGISTYLISRGKGWEK